MAAVIAWRRREAGSYVTTIRGGAHDGVHVAIVNMHGQSVLYSGVGAHWHVRIGGKGDDRDLGSRDMYHAWTFAEAKKWVQEYAEEQS